MSDETKYNTLHENMLFHMSEIFLSEIKISDSFLDFNVKYILSLISCRFIYIVIMKK